MTLSGTENPPERCRTQAVKFERGVQTEHRIGCSFCDDEPRRNVRIDERDCSSCTTRQPPETHQMIHLMVMNAECGEVA